MHPWISVSLYTGQQLVLEGIGRWLQRPCADEPPRRRGSLRSLVVLLLKTAATGVLATVLDAAIEYRRRQLLASLERGGDDAAGSSGSFLSRAGIQAWKERLLVCIDEMERHAEQYGIEPTRRFSGEGKPECAPGEGKDGGGGAAPRLPRSASLLDLPAGEGRQKALARTVEQLRGLVQDSEGGGADAESRLDEQVGTLLDCLLGGEADACLVPTDALAAAAVPCGGSGGALASAAEAALESAGGGAPSSLDGGVCQICMDRGVRVEVAGCRHKLCYQCARRLCTTPDHSVPQCPFCRQSISGWTCSLAA